MYVGWVLDKAISREEFAAGTKYPWLWRPWIFFMRWICPLAILLIFFSRQD